MTVIIWNSSYEIQHMMKFIIWNSSYDEIHHISKHGSAGTTFEKSQLATIFITWNSSHEIHHIEFIIWANMAVQVRLRKSQLATIFIILNSSYEIHHMKFIIWNSSYKQTWQCRYDFRKSQLATPPAPSNHVKIFKGCPPRDALRNWYNCGTNHFHLTSVVRWKWKNQLDWVIQPVPHDLVRRIRFWRIKISGTWF